MKLITRLHLCPRLRVNGAIPLRSEMLSWCGQGERERFTLLHIREILYP